MSAMLDSHAHAHEEFEEYTAIEEARIERETQRLVAEKLTSPVFWDGRLEGINAVTLELPHQLARMMSNLEHACRGDRIALEAITTSLSILHRQAKADARIEAREQAEEALDAGVL